jgi:hypothetical protein
MKYDENKRKTFLYGMFFGVLLALVVIMVGKAYFGLL